MSTIGDLILRVFANMDGFQTTVVKEAEKAGDKAGQTLGQRMSAGIKQNGAKILGAGLAAGFAVATKGLLELEKVTADFAAETGASADEADRAGKAINAMAGRNIQPLAEVGAALTKVHTDLGLTGDEADRVTERFLKFGRATKQNAAAAVVAFDDILDAWGLTAEHAGDIMDKLIVSHQKYGGSIEENEKALAALAPALKAANLKVDDGIGLLNLFQASGVDSAVAVTGMTKALTKVKSPEELKRLVADIIATEDPFLRAQKASDLFGAKAGAKLANALRPGMKGLDDYAISTEEAAGATEKAADVLDSTFGARFQLLMKGAGAALIGFGSNFGPALTGMASLASLAGGLGGGKLLGGLVGVLRKGGVRIAAALGVSFGTAVVSGAAESGGEAIGNLTTKAIGKRLAGKAATDVMAKGLATGLIGLEDAAPIKRATSRIGSAMGSMVGKAFMIGFAATAIILAALKFLEVRGEIERQTKELAEQTGKFTEKATLDALIQARKGVAEKLASMGHDPIGEALGLSARKGVEDSLASLEMEINRRMPSIDQAMQAGAKGIATSTTAIGGSVGYVISKIKTLASDTLIAVNKVKEYVHGLTTTLAAEARAMISGYYDPLIAQADLLVQKDQVAAAERELAATKAGSAERHQANLTLLNAREALEQTRLTLLESGTLTAKEQKIWLSELQTKYKTATGDARAKIGALIAKIKELQGVEGRGIKIVVTGMGAMRGSGEGLASGGPFQAGHAYAVNENTPRTEYFVPSFSGMMYPSAASVPSGAMAGGGGDTYITVPLLDKVEVRTPRDIADGLRMLESRGYLNLRRKGRP